MTLQHLDTVFAFAVVMLGASLLITIFTQAMSTLFAHRGSNLRSGLQVLFETVDPSLAAREAESRAEKVLTHPILSDSMFFRRRNVRVLGWLIRRWRLASAIRIEELVRILPLIGENQLPQADLEAWFNSAMDRVSQRFVQQMRIWTVVFSLLLAFAAHLDVFRLFTQLSSDAEMRSRLIASADTMTKQAGQFADAGLKSDADKLLDQSTDIRSILAKTGYQLIPDPYPRPWYKFAPREFWGTLAAAGLLSLGAPFWFNALKTLSSLRPILATKEESESKKKKKPQ